MRRLLVVRLVVAVRRHVAEALAARAAAVRAVGARAMWRPSKYADGEHLPEYPGRVLFGHVTMKGMQLGSVLGCFSIPVVALVRKQSVGLSARTVFPLTVVGGLSIAYGKLYNSYLDGKLDADGVDDRAYRIIHNRGQVKVDQYTALGAMVGVFAGILGADQVARCPLPVSESYAASHRILQKNALHRNRRMLHGDTRYN
eukprot:gene19291-22753_t